jgi:hypothetical protein
MFTGQILGTHKESTLGRTAKHAKYAKGGTLRHALLAQFAAPQAFLSARRLR